MNKYIKNNKYVKIKDNCKLKVGKNMIDSSMLGNISVLVVFVEGLLSFFSPCVIPMIPLYMGYLSSTSHSKGNRQLSIFKFTLCFILGIFTAILIMNMSFMALASFFKQYQYLFSRIGGIVIILLGLHQFGFIQFNFLKKTFRMNTKPNQKSMSLWVAFAMGFSFSFAWTPCIGPALSSILILASSTSSILLSNFLAITYALGLAIPFFFLGIFTDKLIDVIKRNQKIMNYTEKIGAILLILIGLGMVTGKMNQWTNYLNPPVVQESEENKETENELAAIDFTLKDLTGSEVSLSDYQGKIVFMNFWGTWCPPCQEETKHVQALYDKYKDSEDVVVVTLTNLTYRETSAEAIATYMDEHEYDFPVVVDEDGMVFYQYGVNSYPTTFMIDPEGNVFGYIQGALTMDIMENIIEQTRNAE